MSTSPIFSDEQRLHLQKMIDANNVEDMTPLIRTLKHSEILRSQVNLLVDLVKQYDGNTENNPAFDAEATQQCVFLFTYYTDIYNKIRKNELDLNTLNTFLDVLLEIEEGKLDQHEGSYKVGTILKEMYVNSALRKAAKLEEKNRTSSSSTSAYDAEEETAKARTNVEAIGWRAYKEKKENQRKDAPTPKQLRKQHKKELKKGTTKQVKTSTVTGTGADASALQGTWDRLRGKL